MLDDNVFNLFGSSSSSSSSDDDDDDENTVDDIVMELCHNTQGATNKSDDTTASPLLFHSVIASMADACVLFLTRSWLSPTCRSIPLSQRIVGLHDEHESRMISNTLSSRLQTKGIVASYFENELMTSMKRNDNHKCMMMDAAILSQSFQSENDNYQSSLSSNTTSNSKFFKQSLIHGGILIVNIHIIKNDTLNNYSHTEHSSNNGMNHIEHGTNNITTDIQMIQDILPLLHLSDSVWDLEHAQTVFQTTLNHQDGNDTNTHKSTTTTITMDSTDKKRQCHFFISLAIRKRPCTINTKSCPWKYSSPSSFTNSTQCSKQKIPFSLWEQVQSSSSSSTGPSLLHTPTTSSSSSSSIRTNQHHSTIMTILQYEQYILDQVTITPSVKECSFHHGNTHSNNDYSTTVLSKENIQRACMALQIHGFTIIRNLFHPNTIEPWIQASLHDFQSACSILKNQYQVDLLHPEGGRRPRKHCDNKDDCITSYDDNSYHEPLSYKELAMREDFRVDLRDGPCLQQCRCMNSHNDFVHNDVVDSTMNIKNQETDINEATFKNSMIMTMNPSIIPSQYKGSYESLRFHPDILQIIRQVFNPQNQCNNNNTTLPLYKGNYGRWNFEGSGPDGTPQPLRIGQIGSIISLPGAADQAIHADTPHLFEHVDLLPCHYANLFVVGHDDPNGSVDEDGNPMGDSSVGGTAFIHGTHSLSVCARLMSDDSSLSKQQDLADDTFRKKNTPIRSTTSRDELYARIIRPSLRKGDAILFDCRVLHFGCANTSDIHRPLLYVNMTQAWFHDPKNWDIHTAIFHSN